MFEDNHMDKDGLLLRSILENGQEDVPERVWNGVSQGLDKIARRRRFVWSSVASVAAAAAVAVGVVLWHGEEGMIVPEAEEGMIAVVEKTESLQKDVYIAEVRKSSTTPTVQDANIFVSDNVQEPQEEHMTVENVGTSSLKESAPSTSVESAPSASVEAAPSAWIEDERDINTSRIRTSVTISGIAGTNSPQIKSSSGPLRSPGMLTSPSKTTLERVGSDDTYGIPLSFGAGVKLDITPRWSVGIGLNYSMLTSSFNGKYTKVTNGMTELPVYERVLNTQHYIGIPINAYYNIVNRDIINFYAHAGGAVEKCIGNQYKIQTTPVIHHSEPVKGVQLSVNAGIGVEFMLGRYVGLYIDPSLRYYFRCRQPRSIRTAQPLMLGFEMGFRFNL